MKKITFYYLVLFNAILISISYAQSSITNFTVQPDIDKCDYKYVRFYYIGGNVYSLDSLLWNFGDGHTQRNSFTDYALHTFNTPGVFTVSLTLWKDGIETFIEKTDTIKIYNPPEVSYTYHAASGDSQLIAPVEIHFESSVFKGDGDSLTYNWYEYFPEWSIDSTKDMVIQFNERTNKELTLQVTDENGCDERYTEEIIIVDSIQANEFEYIIGDCNSDNCLSGFNYTLENDTLIIYGEIYQNCCGTHTTAYESVADSLIFHFYHKGDICDCDCMFCFEINVPDISENYMNIHFYNIDTLIVKEGLGFIDTNACDIYISPGGKIWTNNGIYQDTIPNTSGGDSIILIRLEMYENSYITLKEEACVIYSSPSGKIWDNSGIYQDTIPNSNGCDSIITIDLTIKNSTTSSLTEIACESYISPSGKVWTVSGTYIDTIPNYAGCDSILTIDLTIDCSNSIKNNTVIPLSIYPNPANEYINIKLNEIYDDIIMEIYDITGCITSTKKYKNVNEFTYKLNEPPGFFFIKIYNSEGKMSIVKIVKEVE